MQINTSKSRNNDRKVIGLKRRNRVNRLLEKHYALNWLNCLIVCLFWAKSGKYYSKKRGRLMQLVYD